MNGLRHYPSIQWWQSTSSAIHTTRTGSLIREPVRFALNTRDEGAGGYTRHMSPVWKIRSIW